MALAFFWLKRNKGWLKTQDKKEEFIKFIENTSLDIGGLASKLPKLPDADPKCSTLKRKRSIWERSTLEKRGILDGVIDTIQDVASAVSCAAKVATNLVDRVKDVNPPELEIDNLIEALDQLGGKLQELDDPKEPTISPSESESTPSSTSSSASCTSSSAVPICTESVAVLSSFSINGDGTITSVQSVTTTTCTTITGCDVKASTTAVTSASATVSEYPVCDGKCSACTGEIKRSNNDPFHSRRLAKRSLPAIEEDFFGVEEWNENTVLAIENGPDRQWLNWFFDNRNDVTTDDTDAKFSNPKKLLVKVASIDRAFGDSASTTSVSGLVG
jgi:hypothetical protein